MSRYGNMGVKRCVIILEMQTIAIKQLVNRSNRSKFENMLREVGLMALDCNPEALTHLLTPILPYLCITCVEWYGGQIWHF